MREIKEMREIDKKTEREILDVVRRLALLAWNGDVGGLIHGGVIGMWLVESRAKESSQKEVILYLYSTSIRRIYGFFIYFKTNRMI